MTSNVPHKHDIWLICEYEETNRLLCNLWAAFQREMFPFICTRCLLDDFPWSTSSERNFTDNLQLCFNLRDWAFHSSVHSHLTLLVSLRLKFPVLGLEELFKTPFLLQVDSFRQFGAVNGHQLNVEVGTCYSTGEL